MPRRPGRGGPCAYCGHTRSQHTHDMGNDDNQGVEEPGHCRVPHCDCQDYGDGEAGNPQGEGQG